MREHTISQEKNYLYTQSLEALLDAIRLYGSVPGPSGIEPDVRDQYTWHSDIAFEAIRQLMSAHPYMKGEHDSIHSSYFFQVLKQRTSNNGNNDYTGYWREEADVERVLQACLKDQQGSSSALALMRVNEGEACYSDANAIFVFEALVENRQTYAAILQKGEQPVILCDDWACEFSSVNPIIGLPVLKPRTPRSQLCETHSLPGYGEDKTLGSLSQVLVANAMSLSTSQFIAEIRFSK